MPKLITTFAGPAILAGLADPQPDQEWEQLQHNRPVQGELWYSAYLLSGGAAWVQIGAQRVLRDATAEDLEQACRNAVHKPVAAKIRALF